MYYYYYFYYYYIHTYSSGTQSSHDDMDRYGAGMRCGSTEQATREHTTCDAAAHS
jgi:hypothetical protein